MEIRDPIHGFIELNEWEREIINHPAFQRLRRIKQLAGTDMVYPGATHTRFEHSLGVMHVATRMYDQIIIKKDRFLRDELGCTDAILKRDRVLIRLAALLHDVGHAPFSHAGEGTMVLNPKTNKPYEHEDYSAAIIQQCMYDVIEEHPYNDGFGIKAKDISDLLSGSPKLGSRGLLWRSLITSQLDADRADYLLRDSYHIGVEYGKYDLDRLLNTITIVNNPSTKTPTIGVEYGGFHAAEALIYARYQMFTQVYFHHTRKAFDHHIGDVLKASLTTELGNDGVFPTPDCVKNIEEYLKWDDWKVLGMIANGDAGYAGKVMYERKHDKRVYETLEVPTTQDLTEALAVSIALGDKVSFVDPAQKDWYKFDKTDLNVLKEDSSGSVLPLSTVSSIVKGLQPINQIRIYVPNALKEDSITIVDDIIKNRGEL